MSRSITTDSVVTVLSAIAQVAGDTVYQPPGNGSACVYTDPDTKAPSCIVGQVIAAHGFDHTLCTENRSPAYVLPTFGVSGEGPIADLLGCVQYWQDRGLSWRDAVRRGFENNNIKEFPNV